MSCTVLLAAFSGLLRDKQLKPKPIEWIESLEDLLEWKDIRIATHELSNFNIYLENIKGDPVVDNFRERKNVTEGIEFHIAQSEGQSAFLISCNTLLQEQYAHVLNMV